MDSQFSTVKIMKGLHCFLLLSMMSLCDASSMKIPLKSIKSPDGDIIDCVHISHQPAFDHPLLKHHTILKRPSYYPGKGMFAESDTEPITQLWQLNGRCPEGTIPVRRNQNRSNIKRYAIKKHRRVSQLSAADRTLVNESTFERAFAFVQGKKYFGAKATINLWQPRVQNHNEFSSSQIWIIGGPDTNLNTIEAGWVVFPTLFGDNNTRLFTYWTKDAYRSTGCYNLQCSGFVQISKKIALGATISPVSTYHGRQLDIGIYIFKDPKLEVWWLQYGNHNILGYWPASLFTYLASSGSLVGWGGEVVNSALHGRHTRTQMGSGHYPKAKFGGSSYFKNIQVIDESTSLRPPWEIKTLALKRNCYNITELGKSDDWGDFFYYGGPGRNVNCP